MSSPASNRRRYGLLALLGYVTMLICLLISVLITLSNASPVLDNNRLVIHTHEVLQTLEQVYSATLDAESNQRGYVVTGQEIFLDGWKASKDRALKAFEQAKVLTKDNPTQQERIARLSVILNQKLATTRLIEVRQEQGLQAAINVVSEGGGRRLMDQIRVQLNELESAERQLLTDRQSKTQQSIVRAVAAYLIATIAGIALLTGLYIVILRFVRLQAKALVKEAVHRTELEQKIEQKEKAEAEVNRVLADLERSNRELQDFAFVASHDLQEPLRKIQAFGDRIKTKERESMGPESLDYLDRMLNAASRMQVLINDILNLSRIATKVQPFIPVNLNETVVVVQDDLRSRIEETGAQIKVGKLPTVAADPTQMQQLLLNLIGNALKFRREDVPPEIFIDSKEVKVRDEKMAKVTVRDNGIGFETRHADKIFTVFQRLHGRGEYEGTGIGLAICRRIVERHGGTISATSTLGEGTTFEILLPVKHVEGS